MELTHHIDKALRSPSFGVMCLLTPVYLAVAILTGSLRDGSSSLVMPCHLVSLIFITSLTDTSSCGERWGGRCGTSLRFF